MARNFKIFMHQAIDELHIGLKGDFDGSSALELIHMLKQNVNRYGRILIDTHNLKKIYPFGRDVFNYNFIKLKDHRSRIHFIGPDDLQTGQIDLNVAKVGGLQSQGVKGEAVVIYRNPLTTQDLKSSDFPGGSLSRSPEG